MKSITRRTVFDDAVARANPTRIAPVIIVDECRNRDDDICPDPITTAADYVFYFRFSGALFDSNMEKNSVQEAIDLLCVFPDSGTADPMPTGFSWSGGFALSVTFSELQPSTSSRRVYYLLRIRGGAGGVSTEEGFRLEEDLEQLLVTAIE